MKAKVFLFSCFVFLFLCPLRSFGEAVYREKITSSGKVIIGPDKESALEKFGVPNQASKEFWYYSIPEKFFVFFPAHSQFNIYLYPRHSNSYVDTPLEFKVFGYFSDLKIKDITKDAQLLINEPEDFVLDKPGIIIPRKAGEYQVLAKYNNIFSNPAYLKIEEALEKGAEKYAERLISINVLPYKPAVTYRGRLTFMALGVFLDSSGAYFIRDISNQASWFIKQDKKITENEGSSIFFPSIGKVTVFSRYRGLEGFSQEIYVHDKPFMSGESLKHITLLPEFMSVVPGKNINLRAFGTYQDNRIEDITNKVVWDSGDSDIAAIRGAGVFLTKSTGITEVTAGLDNLKSLAAKIIVADKVKAVSEAPAEEKIIRSEDLFEDIKDEVKKIKEGLAKEEKKLSLIKITPDTLEIPFGESRQVTAQGIYSDNSQEDLTRIGDWASFDDKVVMVSAGKIDTLSSGEAKINIKFKGINSLPALVKVVGPKLASIVLSPQSLQISMMAKPALKAEGYFSDSSHKDITQLVGWKATDTRIVKVEKGIIFPLKFGEAGVYAEYSGVKSIPANIRVVFTMDWFIHAIIKWLCFLLLGIAVLFTIFYFLTEKRKNDLMNSLDKNPDEFIVNLYENTKKILAIFNLNYKDSLTPASYAELVQKSYSIENNLFLSFTAKFEEAKYSHHVLSGHDANLALSNYNELLKMLFSRYNKLYLFLKYCQALLHRTMFYI